MIFKANKISSRGWNSYRFDRWLFKWSTVRWWHKWLWYIKYIIKSTFEVCREYGIVWLWSLFLVSWRYIGIICFFYLLHWGQLGKFVLMSITIAILSFLTLVLWNIKKTSFVHRISNTYTIKLSCAILVAYCGYDSSVYRTGIFWFVAPLAMIYMMMIYLRHSIIQILIWLFLWWVLSMLFALFIFPKLNR